MTTRAQTGPGGSGGLQPLAAPRSLREEVFEQLRGVLIAGRLQPGVIYSVPSLARELGVSATPVREALLDLARDGFVQVVRNKGFRVTELSEHDLDEIYEVRALLEIPAVERLAREAPLGQLVHLRPLADGIVAAAKMNDPVAYVEADRRFHLALLSLLGNARLVSVIGRLRAQTRLLGLTELAHRQELDRSSTEHEQLLFHIENRDAAAATALMRKHLLHTRGLWAGREETAEELPGEKFQPLSQDVERQS